MPGKTIESFKREIAASVRAYDKFVVCLDKTPDHFMSIHPMGGASGAINACMGMYLLLRAGADIEFKYFFWFFYMRAGEFEIPAWAAISFWFLKDLLWAVLGMAFLGLVATPSSAQEPKLRITLEGHESIIFSATYQ